MWYHVLFFGHGEYFFGCTCGLVAGCIGGCILNLFSCILLGILVSLVLVITLSAWLDSDGDICGESA